MRTRARRWVVPLFVALTATMPAQDAGGTTPAVPPGSCAPFGLTAVSDPVLQRSSTMPMFADGDSRYLRYSSSHPKVDAPQNQLNGFRLDLDTGSRVLTSVHPSGGPLPHGPFGGA